MQELAGEWKRRLLDAIAHEAYQHSSEAEVARRAELHPRFLSQARKRGRIQLDQALALIAALGRDPGDFIARTLGHTLPVPVPAPPPTEAPFAFVERAYDRAQSRLPTTIPRSHLEHLSDQRESSPQRVLWALEASLDHIAPEDVPFALGIWSTLQRVRHDYAAAEQGIAAGLELTEGNPDEQGELLLKREAVVKRQSLDWVAGERIAAQVSEMALQSGNSTLLGRSLVARMINARLLGDFDRAIDMGEQALWLLPAEDNRALLFATLEVAANHARLGRAEDSRRVLGHLNTRCRPSSPWEEAWVRWFEALIADALGDHASAEQAMTPIYQTMTSLDLYKATDAAIDKACFIIHQGQSTRSIDTLRQLLNQCLRGTLAPAQLERTLEELPASVDESNYDLVRRRIYHQIQRAKRAQIPSLGTSGA